MGDLGSLAPAGEGATCGARETALASCVSHLTPGGGSGPAAAVVVSSAAVVVSSEAAPAPGETTGDPSASAREPAFAPIQSAQAMMPSRPHAIVPGFAAGPSALRSGYGVQRSRPQSAPCRASFSPEFVWQMSFVPLASLGGDSAHSPAPRVPGRVEGHSDMQTISLQTRQNESADVKTLCLQTRYHGCRYLQIFCGRLHKF